jgi:hypothetical protein
MAAMTYLQLCQKLVEKCGISGAGPTSVIGQTGEMKRVIGWINEAYLHIQELHPDWKWMRGSASFSTIANQQAYTPAQCGVTDFAEWDVSTGRNTFRLYQTSVGYGSEIWLQYLPYDDFRDYMQYGAQRNVTGKPLYMTVNPAKSILLGYTPDSTDYTTVGDYYKTPGDLAADADVPLMPARFHMLIVYKAMQIYASYESAPEVMSEGRTEYRTMKRHMEKSQLPELIMGRPLV